MFDVHICKSYSCRSSGTVSEPHICWLCEPDKSISAAPGEVVAGRRKPLASFPNLSTTYAVERFGNEARKISPLGLLASLSNFHVLHTVDKALPDWPIKSEVCLSLSWYLVSFASAVCIEDCKGWWLHGSCSSVINYYLAYSDPVFPTASFLLCLKKS